MSLYDEIRRLCPRRILEVGTNDGLNAVEMTTLVRKLGVRDVEYYGFDLFEALDDKRMSLEFAIRPRSQTEVAGMLRRRGVEGARLFAGDTRKTLPAAVRDLPKMDLVFIDGGHSYETVLSDWASVEPVIGPSTSVFFDDYPSFGVGRAVDEIDRNKWDITVFPTVDRFDHGGTTLEVQLARARHKG